MFRYVTKTPALEQLLVFRHPAAVIQAVHDVQLELQMADL